MTDSFDLKAYLARIGYDGPLTPTYETLRDVHRLHSYTLPFENLNPLMGWAIPLDGDSLQQKMVYGRRGGYCFEQNLLLRHALQAIGFDVTGLAARVLSNRPPDSLPARTHMLLLVQAEGVNWLADAGFGSMTLTEPVKLELDTVQTTSHERRRIVAAPTQEDPEDASASADPKTQRTNRPGGNGRGPDDRFWDDRPRVVEYIMQAGIRDEWRPLFRFNLEPQALVDYEMANFYVSNRPGSHFTNSLTAARPTPTGRYGLRNNELATHDLEGNTERQTLPTAEQLRDAMGDLFHIDVPKDPKLEHVLRRIAAGETVDEAP